MLNDDSLHDLLTQWVRYVEVCEVEESQSYLLLEGMYIHGLT